ncbi:hypothetical protein F5146DRAFT_999057 [Armillaria mellea]|nr:hypothetical protein F5146DRAFT_999057 [Armillaria mellea]
MPVPMKYMQFKNSTNMNIMQWAFACALSHSGCGYWGTFVCFLADSQSTEAISLINLPQEALYDFSNYCDDTEWLSKEGEMTNLLKSSKASGFMPASSPTKGGVTLRTWCPDLKGTFPLAKAIQAVRDALLDNIIDISLDSGDDSDDVVKEEHQEKVPAESLSCSAQSAKGKEKQNMHGSLTPPQIDFTNLPTKSKGSTASLGKQGYSEESPQTLLEQLNTHDTQTFLHLVILYEAHSDDFRKLWDICNKCSHYFPKVYA